MRFKILKESKAYHYGDLEYGKKTDTRSMMMGRGTGHFGTGFYFLGKYEPEKVGTNYNKRDRWEIDLDSYRLFKPRSNSEGYDLHDSLKIINDLSFNPEIVSYLDISYYQLIDELYDTEDKYEDDVGKGLLEFIDKYDKDRNIISDWDLKQAVEEEKWGKVEDIAKDIIKFIENSERNFNYAISDLRNIFLKSEEELREKAKRAITTTNSTDSASTIFMKSLGYEGVDVTHLSKDGDGLSGLDNTKYGTVIYDLKPGTYKKIN